MSLEDMNRDIKQLIGEVGELKGAFKALVPKVERALNNQEEAFERLKNSEVLGGKNEVQIGNLKEDMKTQKRWAGVISFIVSAVANVAKFLFWKDG